MHKDRLQDKWQQMKGVIQRQWGRLTNADVDRIEGNLEKLVGAVQERYGYARERAEKEVEAFRRRQAEAQAGRAPADAAR